MEKKTCAVSTKKFVAAHILFDLIHLKIMYMKGILKDNEYLLISKLWRNSEYFLFAKYFYWYIT